MGGEAFDMPHVPHEDRSLLDLMNSVSWSCELSVTGSVASPVGGKSTSLRADVSDPIISIDQEILSGNDYEDSGGLF